jgi:hypothetical protein
VPTPETKHKLKIPSSIILKGLLTTVQCESILHASAQHELRLPTGERAGYFLGDGEEQISENYIIHVCRIVLCVTMHAFMLCKKIVKHLLLVCNLFVTFFGTVKVLIKCRVCVCMCVCVCVCV